LVTCGVKYVTEGKMGGRMEVTEDEREVVSSYCMILMKRDNTVFYI
jgi:hypothetical protein